MAITFNDSGTNWGLDSVGSVPTFTFTGLTSSRGIYNPPEEAKSVRRFKIGDSVKDPTRFWVGTGRVVALWPEKSGYDYVVFYPDTSDFTDLHKGSDERLDFKGDGSHRYRFYPDKSLESAVYSDGLDNWE